MAQFPITYAIYFACLLHHTMLQNIFFTPIEFLDFWLQVFECVILTVFNPEMKKIIKTILTPSIWVLIIIHATAQNSIDPHTVAVTEGYANTSVNATIFRRNSVSSYKDYQVVAFYDGEAHVMLAKRKLGDESWTISKTQYKGNVRDAHNIISIMHDGDGYLHMSWDHHNDPLRYAVSTTPESIDMGPKQIMIGSLENSVTYPEFYRWKNGDLLFFYRDGSSGNGNLVMNHYNLKKKKWARIHDNLVDGEGERNAYWQMCIDVNGTIHLSWVWRETGDVATNHDMCYARSRDKGNNWETSTGQKLVIPINAETAEYALRIPQNSNLINQTSMTADQNGNPYIATYFQSRSEKETQFKVIHKSSGKWEATTISNRKTPIILGGTGTRSIPVSRPQIIHNPEENRLHVAYRDEEYGNRMRLASAEIKDIGNWKTTTITDQDLNRWEPSFDTELWRNKQQLHLYLQAVRQGQGDKTTDGPIKSKVHILEIIMD
jgi:hypothetical protein